MKKKWLLLLSLFMPLIFANSVKAQDWGMSIAYGTSSSIYADFFYVNNDNAFHLGGTYQFTDTKGKLVNEQKSNYGRTVDGTGEYFWSIDFGYGRYLTENLSLNGELSIGALNNFKNYIDNRFNGGGYHMIESSDITGGIGANISYRFSDYVSVFSGYNTLRQVTFGLRANFLAL